MATESSFSKFRAMPRKTIRVSEEDLVHRRPLFEDPERALPLLVEASSPEVDLAAWAAPRREELEAELLRAGGILFRNFAVGSVERFQEAVRALSGEPLAYTERSSPRSQVKGKVYTSTDYPPEHEIFLHNEQSYNLTFPTKIAFYCVKKAAERGETPVADSRRIYRRIDPEIRRRFEERGYRYVRNLGAGFGLPWQEAFQTEDPGQVESYCRDHAIEWQWRDGHSLLRTSQQRRVVARHPKSGELSWFNHLTFFHVSTLVPAVRDALRAEFAEEDLPNNTYYGDGAPVEPEVMAHLQGIYREEKVDFPWLEGDLLLLDNVLSAHARNPYVGERKVVVAMADPVSWDQV